MKNPYRALEFRAKIGSAAVCKNTRAALTLFPNVINSFYTGKDFILENLFRYIHKYNFIGI